MKISITNDDGTLWEQIHADSRDYLAMEQVIEAELQKSLCQCEVCLHWVKESCKDCLTL